MFEHRTLARVIKFSGIGLHSGKIANVRLVPSDIGTGIRAIRTDILDRNNEIKLDYTNVSIATYSTKISNEFGACVNTVEHLMAAIWAMKISNLTIEIDAEEMPIMNGSAQEFVFLLEAAGVLKQGAVRAIAKINRKICVNYDDGREISVEPADNFIATFHLNDLAKIIASGSGYTFNDAKQSFINDISLARTYCKMSDVEKLKAAGLAGGGGLHNAIVVDGETVLNSGGLHYNNEFVRHKILDLIGDFALCDYYIAGHFTGKNSGHEMNNKLMREIFAASENFTITQ